MSPYLANVSNILHIWVAIHLEFGSGGENHSGNRENKGHNAVAEGCFGGSKNKLQVKSK
jgi:hypothetical protein